MRLVSRFALRFTRLAGSSSFRRTRLPDRLERQPRSSNIFTDRQIFQQTRLVGFLLNTKEKKKKKTPSAGLIKKCAVTLFGQSRLVCSLLKKKLKKTPLVAENQWKSV